MKASKIIIFGLIICAIIALGELYYQHTNPPKVEEEKDNYDRDIDVLNESIPTDIILVGEDIPFRENLIYRKVEEVTEETFVTDKENQVIILSDMDGTLEITNEELRIIEEKVESMECDFYYVGKTKQKRLYDVGILNEQWPEDEYCVALVEEEGRIIKYIGVWAESDVQITKDNRETMARLLVIQMIRVLKERY